ncbi:DUF5776 domain-containing protein [Apilactobacillus xinyiensis]|uniref:DUF5776 domain-containing protein n=1 Tax=Apilactobacillus xinyiensis TaxID=2841032 RepID=UPI001C7D58FE|nr:DUF5776 domain-containing protein [Apilactobacillus xinyiensis]
MKKSIYLNIIFVCIISFFFLTFKSFLVKADSNNQDVVLNVSSDKLNAPVKANVTGSDIYDYKYKSYSFSSYDKNINSVYVASYNGAEWIFSINANSADEATLLKYGVDKSQSGYFNCPKIPDVVEFNNKLYKITSIGDGAFEGYFGDNNDYDTDYLNQNSIQFPKYLKKIGNGAFTGTNIHNIVVPSSVNSFDGGFYQMPSIENFDINPNGPDIIVSTSGILGGYENRTNPLTIKIPNRVKLDTNDHYVMDKPVASFLGEEYFPKFDINLFVQDPNLKDLFYKQKEPNDYTDEEELSNIKKHLIIKDYIITDEKPVSNDKDKNNSSSTDNSISTENSYTPSLPTENTTQTTNNSSDSSSIENNLNFNKNAVFKIMKKNPNKKELFNYYKATYAENKKDFKLLNGQILSNKLYKRVYQQSKVKLVKVTNKGGILSYKNFKFDSKFKIKHIKFGTKIKVKGIKHLNSDITRYITNDNEYITTNNSFVTLIAK